LTEDEAVGLLAEGIHESVFRLGPTKAGLKVGCSDETMAKARDKKTTLRLDLAFNTLLLDERALDPLTAHFRKRLVDVDAGPVNWTQLGAAAAELSAEIHRALSRGHISHRDLPRLKELARAVLTQSEGAVL